VNLLFENTRLTPQTYAGKGKWFAQKVSEAYAFRNGLFLCLKLAVALFTDCRFRFLGNSVVGVACFKNSAASSWLGGIMDGASAFAAGYE
jgi:hypothetical protein